MQQRRKSTRSCYSMIAAKAALHDKVRTHDGHGDNQQGTLSAICLACLKFVCTSDLLLIWYFCTNNMHSFIVATTPEFMKSFQDITMLCDAKCTSVYSLALYTSLSCTKAIVTAFTQGGDQGGKRGRKTAALVEKA